MHQHLVKSLGADTADIHLADGFPMDVCVRRTTTVDYAEVRDHTEYPTWKSAHTLKSS